jgi:hypothetical protein
MDDDPEKADDDEEEEGDDDYEEDGDNGDGGEGDDDDGADDDEEDDSPPKVAAQQPAYVSCIYIHVAKVQYVIAMFSHRILALPKQDVHTPEQPETSPSNNYQGGEIRDDDANGRELGAQFEWKVLSDGGAWSDHDHSEFRKLDVSGQTFVDFIAFKLPDSCANTKNGCDWTELGVGAKHSDGTIRWCCSQSAVTLGLCQGEENYGRLIVDAKKLPGKKRQIAIDNKGNLTMAVSNGRINEDESGNYVMIMANCNDGGRDVLVNGVAAYKSVHGYLPGELWGFLYFFAAMTIGYFVIFLWYSMAMHLNVESRIPIEKWILTTIGLGLSEMVFKTVDAFVWNESGYRQIWLCYMGIMLGVIKRGWSRSLIVMVSLGWGVTRDSLGRKYKWIFMLCMLYIGASAFCDLAIVIAVSEMETISESMETDLYDIYTILTFVIAAIDVIYIMWILDGFASTMEHLSVMHQTRKLKRYLRLRCLFLFAVLFAIAWAFFAVTNAYTDGIVGEEDSWMVDGATQLNYLVVLIGIACLWRPSPSSLEYAYAMELPSGNYEGDGVELEMSGAVPSAADSDDEYDDGYADAKRGATNGGFQDEPSSRQLT